MHKHLQAIVDAHEGQLDQRDLTRAVIALKGSSTRSDFELERLLPPDLAAAVGLITEELPADPLTATLVLLCGYSGLLKIGTRINSSHRYGVPCNLWLALVGKSGQQKTPILRKLISEPAAAIRAAARQAHLSAMQHWKESCKGLPKNERPDPPRPLFPHLQDYTAESLAIQLELQEAKGLGILLLRDELAGLLQSLDADAKRGRGTAEAQLLELFDGTGATSIRVGGGARQFERCHVSLYGNIQPEKLRQLINGNDCTGKFARLLFCKLPEVIPSLRDDDPSPAELLAYSQAQEVLAAYADRLYKQAPKQYRLSQQARQCLHRWWEQHQRVAIQEATDSVISSMLGKTSAHALRLAAMLHMVRSTDELVPVEVMQLAMEIVDQLMAETQAFHDGPTDQAAGLMQHILSMKGEVNWTRCKAEGNRAIRELKAADFKAATQVLEQEGLGTIIQMHPSVVFRAERLNTA